MSGNGAAEFGEEHLDKNCLKKKHLDKNVRVVRRWWDSNHLLKHHSCNQPGFKLNASYFFVYLFVLSLCLQHNGFKYSKECYVRNGNIPQI